MNISTEVWIWVSALLTLAIYSYLYRDNPVYKFAEYLFVGLAAGYYFTIYYRNTLIPNLIDPILAGPKDLNYFWYIVPIGLSILLLSRFVPSISWLSRWPIGFMVGAFAGLAIIGNAQGDLISQVQANLLPLVDPDSVTGFNNASGIGGKLLGILWMFGNILLIVGLITTLIFFFFSLEHKGPVGATAKVGVYFLMLSFGASFGFTVMSRISLLLERLRFLYGDWLGFTIVR
ncbi:MAG: hypothetical protein SGI90_12035 [Candidatus Eisenbacteria bacterium]|nr:hypothetical protein [Candidatus Eisenbacteria bacterium]